MELGLIGLGKMGGNMRTRLRDAGHTVVGYDRNPDVSDAGSLAEMVEQLPSPKVVWVMVPSGDPTRDTVRELGDLLGKGDLVVDGGNSKWTDDRARAAQLRTLGIDYVDVGTSGGVWGLEVGYCMMVGGPAPAVKRLAPILDVLAPETNELSREALGPRGWAHFGPSGAGHYVKMVHNGIEYGLMQAYAEGFDIFDKSEFDLDKAKIAHLWNQGSVVRSWLCELAARAFEMEGNDLENLEPYVEDSGEGRWTVEDAIEKRIPMPVITTSLFERFSSRGQNAFAAKVNAALRNQFGGHAVKSKAQPAEPSQMQPAHAE
jgi:6-phosphogluconate dehydrogenase